MTGTYVEGELAEARRERDVCHRALVIIAVKRCDLDAEDGCGSCAERYDDDKFFVKMACGVCVARAALKNMGVTMARNNEPLEDRECNTMSQYLEYEAQFEAHRSEVRRHRLGAVQFIARQQYAKGRRTLPVKARDSQGALVEVDRLAMCPLRYRAVPGVHDSRDLRGMEVLCQRRDCRATRGEVV